MKRYIKSANGSLYNNDHGLYYKCLNHYKVTFADGEVRYARAKCKYDAELLTARYDKDDNEIDIVSVEELDY